MISQNVMRDSPITNQGISLASYRIFRKTLNILDVRYIHNFIGYRSIWYMNESPLSRAVCVYIATPEHWAKWRSTHNLWGNPKGNNGRDSCPVNVVARTIHTRNAVEINSTGHGYQTRHAGRPRRHSLMWACTFQLEKCVHVASSLNGRNDLTVQLFQVTLVCYGAIGTPDLSNKLLLADLHPTWCIFPAWRVTELLVR
jgi:hypothetical protein